MKQPFFYDRKISKFFLVISIGTFVSILHFFTPIHTQYLHLIYDRLGYLPVILAAFWFGIWGGVLMGCAMSTMHLIHIYINWGGIFLKQTFIKRLKHASTFFSAL